MYVHYGKKLVFLAHPRTASNAVSVYLTSQEGFEALGAHHSTLYENTNRGKRRAQDSPVTKDNRDEWIVFTTVRNHYDALVSWRGNDPKLPSPMSAEYIRSISYKNYYVKSDRLWWLHEDVDVTMRYETLERDLEKILGHSVLLPVVKVSQVRGRRPYQDFYDEAGVAYVKEAYGAEMERFGYEFEGSP